MITLAVIAGLVCGYAIGRAGWFVWMWIDEN